MVLLAIPPYRMLGGAFSIAKVVQYQRSGTAKHIENEGADGKLKLVTDLTILILCHIAGVDVNINFSSYRRSRV